MHYGNSKKKIRRKEAERLCKGITRNPPNMRKEMNIQIQEV
jgi:hypothetical protein